MDSLELMMHSRRYLIILNTNDVILLLLYHDSRTELLLSSGAIEHNHVVVVAYITKPIYLFLCSTLTIYLRDGNNSRQSIKNSILEGPRPQE